MIILLFPGEQEASHVPTAERVFRIFHGDGVLNSSESPSDVEELLEIDFTDLGRIMGEFEGLEAAALSSKETTGTSAENPGDHVGIPTVGERFKGFCIDIKPPPLRPSHLPIDPTSGGHPETCAALGEDMDEDDEIIVYDAPLPRNGKLATCQIQSSFTATAPLPHSADNGPIAMHRGTCSPPYVAISPLEPVPQCKPAPPSPSLLPPLKSGDASSSVLSEPASYARGRRHISSKRMNRYATFSSFGAIRAEIALRKVDPRVDDQRRGDSDIDWGGSTSEESAGDEGMLVDQDIDTHAMEAFVKGMSTSGMAHGSADDMKDEERTRAEHEERSDAESTVESDDSAGDTELELADDMRDMLISVDESENELTLGNALVDEDESTSDEGETPKRSFQARLERLRKRTKGRPIKDILEDELEQALEADEEDSIIAKIHVTQSPGALHTTEGITPRISSMTMMRYSRLKIASREIASSKPFIKVNLISSSTLSVARQVRFFITRTVPVLKLMYLSIFSGRKKNNFIPEELRDQWERDRAKKAERKRLRELERIAAAVDPFRTRKGGKKARKAKLAAASATSVSLETIVGYMKRFVADTRGPRTLPLPPMNRKIRKLVHELAHAFKLESKSKGNGAERFTTLKKTTLSSVDVDERKIAQILRNPSLPYVTHEGGKGKGKGKRKGKSKGKGMADRTRPRDGDVVGEVRVFHGLLDDLALIII